MKHFHITFKPDGAQISIHKGATLLEAAAQCGIILDTVCGAQGTCNKCLVSIDPDEAQVLACQYEINSDLTVTIPHTSRFFEQKILAEGISLESDTSIYKKYTLDASEKAILGVAIDLGTTTVAAKLLDMKDASCLATATALNPQIRFGDDCITRIAYADTDEKLKQLHKATIACINDLVAELSEKASVESGDIYELSLVGNTAMNHIFLALPLAQLGQAPYIPFSVKAADIVPREIGIKINPAGNVHAVECIAGFVGADTTAVALAASLDSTSQITLVIDIGTNGEIVLGSSSRLVAASCAAGPALEGARITHGGRAADGAIEAVVINDDDIDIDVIGEASPHSICGSGLIDAVAVLLDLDILTNTGAFSSPESLKGKLPPKILSRLTLHDDQPAFKLYQGEEKSVILTQRDIRQLQLAKAAIRAGIQILQKKLAIEDDDIQQVLLAGAFGNYIRKESALRIGLLPHVAPEKIHFIGNAACSGAQMILLSDSLRQRSAILAQEIEYIEIASQKDFSDLYADAMCF